MSGRVDIHDYDARMARAEGLLRRGNPISRRNAELIEKFMEHCISIGLSKARVTRYAFALKKLAEFLGKDFDKATKEDIKELVVKIESSDYSPWTKQIFKVTLKRFYKWLKGGDREYPEEVKWIKTTLSARDRMLPEDLLTEEEIKAMVDAMHHPRDKAFIMTLYESGARIGELGSMRIKDVKFEEKYAVLMLKGKTGPRRVMVVVSVPYLRAWLEVHPLKDDPDAPLWVNIGTVNRFKAASYPTLAKILKVAAKRAGIKKRVTPHILRHSRATFLASRLTEAQMCEIFGWVQGSKMPSIYVHLSGRDVDDAVLGIYGLKKSEEKEPKLKPKICPRCGTVNTPDAMFCSKCGLALDIKAAMQMEETKRRIDAIMNKLMEDEEFRTFMMKKIQELGLV